ncbi:MAG: DNA polymerase III subunit delta' [Rhizobacter sp.]|nr:DNA polymerase III subunit delta' [Rhizobacter sp.]
MRDSSPGGAPESMPGGVLPWLAAPLHEALRTQRGHALLVQGAQGAGQFEFAIALARAWLCETSESQRPDGLACGHCESCHLATADQVHPDLRVLLPEALHLALGWQRPGDAADAGEGKKKPSEWISIKQVRQAIEFSTLTSGRGRLKIVVIYPAERMPPAAASALLKLLEEPQGGQRFVLGCGDAAALLPTVRSRCHALTLPAPDAALAERWLADAGVVDAPVLIASSGGAPLAAFERHAMGLDAVLWARLPALVAAGDAQPLSRLPVWLVIDSLQKLCHDAMLAACGVAPRYFPAAGVPGDAALPRLADWGQALRRSARHADHPWNVGLMVESLVLQGQRALAGERAPIASATSAAPRDSVHSRR